jgi:hypothetical protein
MENIELHKLAMIIEEKGGHVIDLKTDCIACHFYDRKTDKEASWRSKNAEKFPFELLDDINIKGYYWDKEKTKPKYKLEEGKRLKFGRMVRWQREDKFKYRSKKWHIINDGERTQLKDRVVKLNGSCNIDGKAGTGKTTLLNNILIDLEKLGKKYICLAPTNKSAQLINGKTLHKFINCIKNSRNIDNLKVDVIIVDEISMVNEYFYKYLLIIKQLRPDIKFIVSGDFEQLLPVNDRIGDNFDYKNSVALFELCDGNRIQLTDCYRADKDFFDLCDPKNVKNVEPSMFNNNFTNKHLSFTNDKRIQINKIMMDKKFNEAEIAHIEKLRKGKRKITPLDKCYKLPKKITDPSSQDVILMVGTPIIAKINRLGKKDIEDGTDFSNNEEFVIKDILGDDIYLDNGLIINKDDFQNLFNVAYCITVHKSQGATYDFDYTIHQWHMFSDRMKYVALSRATNKKYINII